MEFKNIYIKEDSQNNIYVYYEKFLQNDDIINKILFTDLNDMSKYSLIYQKILSV